jgi:hypothetical protein
VKLKLDAEGHVVVQDGKPVYIHDDGKEAAVDVAATVATISRLNGEAKGHREAKEAAEAKLKVFEGIEDGDAARKALEVVKNLKDGELVTAGKVQEIKDAAAKAAKDQVEAAARASAEKIAELEKTNSTLQTSLYDEKIGGSFSRSKFIADKVAIPADLLQAQFGRNFKVEDGKIVARDAAGNPIYSRAKPGELADFDEALETIIGGYAHKDSILKGTGNSGSGARDPNGGNGGGKTMSRAAFEALDPAAKAQTMADKVVLTD